MHSESATVFRNVRPYGAEKPQDLTVVDGVFTDSPAPSGARVVVTVDPDGFPLVYSGSRDNYIRVLAIDRPEPTELYALHADDVSPTLWNDDWDGAPLVVQGHLLVGCENSWFYVIRLNRSYGPGHKVRVRPRVAARVPSWDGRLLAARRDRAFSIESSVAYHRGIAYFANSAGLVQGWDVRPTLRRGAPPRRVFRFCLQDLHGADGADVDRGIPGIASIDLVLHDLA